MPYRQRRPGALLRLLYPVLGVLSALVVLMVSSPAEAKARIPIPYHTGEDIFLSGPIPGEFAADPQLKDWSAGYKCEIWGVVWTYFSIKNCTPVVYKDDQYADATDAPELIAAVAAAYKEEDKQVGFWTRWGAYILGLLVVGGIAISALSKEDE